VAQLDGNFNPFDTASPLAQMGVPSYIYEPLVQCDELQANEYYPWLAQSWSFSSSGETLTFNLRPGVRWDDGSAFTATDVAYTFNLVRENPVLGRQIPIVSAVATNPRTFTLTLSRPGYEYLFDIAKVPIVKAGFAAGHNPASYVDKSPDGTGPYVVAQPSDLSRSRVVLTARSRYWQGPPGVHQLVFPTYKDQTAVRAALAAGTLDWASVGSAPSGATPAKGAQPHYWAPPVQCISLELNLEKPPEGQLAYRQAVSDAIDRQAVSSSATGGADPPATSLSGLLLPADKAFLVPSDTADVPVSGTPASAKRIMLRAGYRVGAGGRWAGSAGPLPSLSIEDPVGTPLAAAAGVVAAQLRAAGFDATAVPVTTARWYADLEKGTYDASIVPSWEGPPPYYAFEGWLDTSLLSKGKAKGGDYERLSTATDRSVTAAARKDLAALEDNPPGTPGEVAVGKALGRLVAENLPVVPLMYGVAGGAYSTRHFTGWPSQQDPYEPAVAKGPYAEYTVLQLSPVAP
jgi:peptide/nickel transport system substrate-binding protein